MGAALRQKEIYLLGSGLQLFYGLRLFRNPKLPETVSNRRTAFHSLLKGTLNRVLIGTPVEPLKAPKTRKLLQPYTVHSAFRPETL